METAEPRTRLKRVRVKRYKPDPDSKQHYLNSEKGIWSWLSTVDHKRYLTTSIIYLLMAHMDLSQAHGRIPLGVDKPLQWATTGRS